MVENYEKSNVVELDEVIPFSPEFASSTIVRVKAGSKIPNLATFAENQLINESCKRLIFEGYGDACTKVVSVVELVKRRFDNTLHQLTKIRFRRIEEYWDPKNSELERLKVSRDIPAMYILLSKEPLNDDQSGYQPPGARGHSLWQTQSRVQQDPRRLSKSKAKANPWRRVKASDTKAYRQPKNNTKSS